MTAVVLAGGPPDAVAALAPGVPNKTFVPVAGVPLVARTIAPLRRVARIARVVAIVPEEARADAALAQADETRCGGARIADSLRAGLAGLPEDEFALIVAGDMPLLSPAAVEEFLALADASRADLVYACLERATHEAAYPEMPHTWARLRDGTFCGGGCVALRPRAFANVEGFLDRLGKARKNPVALASIFGWDVVARYLAGRLSIAAAEARASSLVGAPVRAAICTHAEIAVNVDRPGDVALAERALSASG